MPTVKVKDSMNVHICDAVPISETESIIIPKKFLDPPQPSSSLRRLPGIHQRYLPRLGETTMHFHRAMGQINCHIGLMQKVIVEILLNHIALVPKAYDEIV